MLVSSEKSSTELYCKFKWVLLFVLRVTLYYISLLKVPQTNSASRDNGNSQTQVSIGLKPELHRNNTLCNRKMFTLGG